MVPARWKALWITGVLTVAYLFVIFGFVNLYLLAKTGHSISRIESLFRHLWASDNPFNPTAWPDKWHEKLCNIILNIRYLWTLF